MNWSVPLYRLGRGFLALFFVLLIGTIGYRLIEGWSLIDSCYMTVNTLKQERAKFIVIDKNAESFTKALQLDYLAIQDDGTKDEVLKKARIDQARGLIAAFGDDADNTYVILAARDLNPPMPIIARANNEDAIKKYSKQEPITSSPPRLSVGSK